MANTNCIINANSSEIASCFKPLGADLENAGYVLGLAKGLRTVIEYKMKDNKAIFENDVTYKDEMISRVNDLISVCAIYIGSALEN